MKSFVVFGSPSKVRRAVETFLDGLKDGARVRIEVQVGSRRTLAFNNYYHGACGYVAKQLEGWTNDEVHEHSKIHCNPIKKMLVEKRTGEIRETIIGGSTRRMIT